MGGSLVRHVYRSCPEGWSSPTRLPPLQVSLAPWLLLASAALATAISWLQGGEEMGSGDAIAGLQYSIALQALTVPRAPTYKAASLLTYTC